jgi:hypothetical protein
MFPEGSMFAFLGKAVAKFWPLPLAAWCLLLASTWFVDRSPV